MLADGYTDGRLGIAVGRHGLQSCRVRPVRVRRPLGSPALGVCLPCPSVRRWHWQLLSVSIDGSN